MISLGIAQLGKRAHTGKVQQYVMSVLVSILVLIFAIFESARLTEHKAKNKENTEIDKKLFI